MFKPALVVYNTFVLYLLNNEFFRVQLMKKSCQEFIYQLLFFVKQILKEDLASFYT